MKELSSNILLVGSLATAISAVITLSVCLIKAYNKQHEQRLEMKQHIQAQDSAIEGLKDENCLICFALSACLDGLEQLGANHTVPKARDKLDKYINQQAHK